MSVAPNVDLAPISMCKDSMLEAGQDSRSSPLHTHMLTPFMGLVSGLHHPLDMMYHIQPWMIITLLPLSSIAEGYLPLFS